MVEHLAEGEMTLKVTVRGESATVDVSEMDSDQLLTFAAFFFRRGAEQLRHEDRPLRRKKP